MATKHVGVLLALLGSVGALYGWSESEIPYFFFGLVIAAAGLAAAVSDAAGPTPEADREPFRPGRASRRMKRLEQSPGR